jgi:aminobenzoyl-glutamate utilization protein B
MTIVDLMTRPDVVQGAKDYFNNVQLKQRKYTPLIRAEDQPAIHLNEQIMNRYRTQMKKYYFDKTKYKTYMDQMKAQFGYSYPTTRAAGTGKPKQ